MSRINKTAKAEINTGFGTNSSLNGGRFTKKDGSSNLKKTGISTYSRYSIYHTMLDLPRSKFFLAIFCFFIIVNLVFASIYYWIGIEQLGGVLLGSQLQNFAEAFFFSAQTFTTVGYGRIAPSGILASAIAALEALVGLLSFAVVTGLFYGRFSRPRAYVKFSHNMIISPYKNSTALMFRLVPYKNNLLTEAEVKVTIAMKVKENGQTNNKFYSLDLEIARINSLTLNWTVVHPIDEKSPIYGLGFKEMEALQIEVLVFLKAFDEAFSNTVVSRTSYTYDEIIFGAKFKAMYEADPEGGSTILHLDRLNDTEKAELPSNTIANSQEINNR